MVYSVEEITERVRPVAEKYKLKSVYLFGSYARGDATEESDVDMLVDTAGVCGMYIIEDLHKGFSEALGKEVDIVPFDMLPENCDTPPFERFIKEIELDGRRII